MKKLLGLLLIATLCCGWTHGVGNAVIPSTFFGMAQQLGVGGPAPPAAMLPFLLAKGFGIGPSITAPTERTSATFVWTTDNLYVARAVALQSEYLATLNSIPIWVRANTVATTASTASGNDTLTFLASDVTKLTIGTILSGSNLQANSAIIAKPTSTTVQLSKTVGGAGIGSGITLTITFVTTDATSAGSDILTMGAGDVARLPLGAAISGTNIPSSPNTYIIAKPSSTTIQLSAVTTGAGVANGASITLVPATAVMAPRADATPAGLYANGDAFVTEYAKQLCLTIGPQSTYGVVYELGNELSESGGLTDTNRGMRWAYYQAQLYIAAFQANGCTNWIITTPSMYYGTGHYQRYVAYWASVSDIYPPGNGVDVKNYVTINTGHGYSQPNFYSSWTTPGEFWYVNRNGNSDSVGWSALTKAVLPAQLQNNPFWVTEGSWGTDGPGLGIGDGTPNRPAQAAATSRALMLAWAKGAKRYYWYNMDGGDGGVVGLNNWGQLVLHDGTLVDAGTAWIQTRKWMLGAWQIGDPSYTNTGNVETSGNGVWSIQYGRPGGYLGLAIWNTGTLNSTTGAYGGSSTYTVPASPAYVGYCSLDGTWTAVNANDGVTIDMSPRLFETARTSC